MPAGASLIAHLLDEKPKLSFKSNALLHIQLVNNGDSFSFGENLGISGRVEAVSIGDGKNLIVTDEGYGFSDEIIDKINSEGAAKPIFWASAKALPPEDIWNGIKKDAFLLLDGDVLRRNGALISRGISWERTVTDLLWQLRNNKRLSRLLGTRTLFVIFGDEAGVLISGEGDGLKARLVLLNGASEGATKSEFPADIPDVWTVKVFNAIAEWQQAIASSGDIFDNYQIYDVLYPAGELRKKGYSLSDIENVKFDDWNVREVVKSAVSFEVPIQKDKAAADPDYWCIGQSFNNTKLYDLAFNYVKYGKSVIEGIPKFTCGKLTTVDRREIEAFQNIKNLIVEYAAKKNPPRPLSIAVFGAPGSGKSFGVKQIAKTLLSNVETLEVNVSQLAGVNDLTAAFHKVRDSVLKGRLPLVFFDEFDSDKEGVALGWLKSFLAPMQDGEFKDESGVHPLGKCIMVFAGGTAPTFDDFVPDINDERFAGFKGVKGPDFASRLRGTINILGPNQVASSTEQGFILRRALLLRSFIEGRKLTNKSKEALVSEDIIRAMLLIPKYEHGARSMEAIFDMSRMEGASFEPVSLPFYTQMKLHLDANAFSRLLLRDVILNGYMEDIAKAIHEEFLSTQKKRNLPVDENVDMPYEQLSQAYKNDNRAQAADLPRKLSLIGCSFDSELIDAPFETLQGFSEEEIRLIAVEEHERWMKDKISNGWKYGKKRDDNAKTHPLIVDFDKLPDDEKEKDLDAAKNIFKLLKDIGLRVYRVV
jgi:hypothetical protein